MFRPQSSAIIRLYIKENYQLSIHAFCVRGGGGVCGIGWGGGFRLIGKHARIEICLLIPMFLGLGFMSIYTKFSGLI